MNKNHKLEELLNIDPIAMLETELGKGHDSMSDDELMSAVAIQAAKNHAEIELLSEMGDVHDSISWDDFLALIQARGFIITFSQDFLYDKKYVEQEIVAYHPKGLVLYANSFWNKSSLNTGTLSFDVVPKDNTKESNIKLIERLWGLSIGGGCVLDTIHDLHFDIREGLFWKIEEIEKVGKILPVWESKDAFLWFVNFVEQQEPGYDYKAITQTKIEQMSEQIRKIIGR